MSEYTLLISGVLAVAIVLCGIVLQLMSESDWEDDK